MASANPIREQNGRLWAKKEMVWALKEAEHLYADSGQERWSDLAVATIASALFQSRVFDRAHLRTKPAPPPGLPDEARMIL
jgi:hypothetical protein